MDDASPIMTVDYPDGTQVRVCRQINAPSDRVWRALTSADDLARWAWAGHTNNAAAEVDLRVGGRYAVYTDSNATEHGWPSDRVGVLGVYVEIEPHRRLVYTVHWDAPVGYNQDGGIVLDEVVFVSLEKRNGGTWVERLHAGLPDDGFSAIEHGKGIAGEFEWLADLVER